LQWSNAERESPWRLIHYFFQNKQRKFLRKEEKQIGNLIVINEACQLCGSMALPIGCSECNLLLCRECIEYMNGKRFAVAAWRSWRIPRDWPPVLMFPTGVS
jgi:hypothetical protein